MFINNPILNPFTWDNNNQKWYLWHKSAYTEFRFELQPPSKLIVQLSILPPAIDDLKKICDFGIFSTLLKKQDFTNTLELPTKDIHSAKKIDLKDWVGFVINLNNQNTIIL